MIKIRHSNNLDSLVINEMLKSFNTAIKSSDFEQNLIIEDNEILGLLNYVHLYEKIEINYIYIKENQRNKGYASLLLEKLLELNNYSDITLEVRQSNIPAIKLYEKHGFLIVANRKNYYGNEDAYLMHRKK